MRRVNEVRPSVLLAVALPIAVGAFTLSGSTLDLSAQVTPHPREMGLPTPESTRPDPSDYRVELANGLVAYVVADAAVPLVTLTAFIGAGYVDGPDGAAEVLAHGLRANGPAGLAPGAFHESLRRMTADYSVALGPEQIEITLDVPEEDAWGALALLSGMLLRGPALSQADIDALQSRAQPEGELIYDGSLAGAASMHRRGVLGGGAYGSEPTPADYGQLSLRDVDGYRSRFLVAENVALAVAGPLTMASVEAALAEGLAGMASGSRHERSRSAVTDAPTERSVHTYPAEKLQGWLVIGHELPVVPEEDEAALQVMNYILGGGHFDTRLFRATRDRRGLTNDDSGFLEMNRDGPGTYQFQTYGRPEVVRLLLHLTLEEIDRIRAEPVTEEELFVAKGALADGVFAAGYRDGWAAARTLAQEWVRDGSHEASASYQDRIRSVTAADVLEAARRYLHPERMTTVLVGPLDEIGSAPAMENEGSLSDYGRVSGGR